MKNIPFVILGLMLLFSCTISNEQMAPSGVIPKTGRVVFSCSSGVSGRGSTSTTAPAAVVISIENADDGGIVYDMKKLDLLTWNDSYISEDLTLEVGNYKLTKFIVVDDADQVIYATPIEGSEKAGLVTDPLPVLFSVAKNITKTVIPQVLKIEDSTPASFGYVNFSFEIVAEPKDVTIYFKGQVASFDDPWRIWSLDAITPGQEFTGKYTYNTDAVDNNSIPTVGDYWFTSQPYGIEIKVGNIQFKTDPANVNFLLELVNDHGTPASDNYLLCSYKNADIAPGLHVDHISWQLDDNSLTALDSVILTEALPVLTAWQSLFGISIDGHYGDEYMMKSYYIRAHVTEVSYQPFN